MRHLGLDLGGTYVKWVVLEHGEVAASGQIETRSAAGPEAVIERLVAAGREAGQVDTVGVGVPGLFDDALGATTFLVNVPGDWDGRPVAGPVGDGLGAPVRLINDARAFALAEWTLGAARGCDTAVFFVVGTGVGGGLVVRGAPARGPRGPCRRARALHDRSRGAALQLRQPRLRRGVRPGCAEGQRHRERRPLPRDRDRQRDRRARTRSRRRRRRRRQCR